jgi:hypothetical protein
MHWNLSFRMAGQELFGQFELENSTCRNDEISALWSRSLLAIDNESVSDQLLYRALIQQP